MSAEIHVDDVGTVFRSTIKDNGVVLPVDSATSILITFKKPDRSTIERTAVLDTDGLDGKVKYVSVSGDLDQPGDAWKAQFTVTLPSGLWHSDFYTFKVERNL